MTISEIHKIIVHAIKAKEDKRHSEEDRVYHRGYMVRAYGLRASVLAEILSCYKKEIVDLSCENVFRLASKFYKARTEEEVMTGNYVLQARLAYFNASNLGVLDKFSSYLVSWSTTDDFLSDVVQPLMFRFPESIIGLAKKWNKSKNIWQRRASVVVFTRKVGATGLYTKDGLQLCRNLINDKEDLIQKAVGWALKDLMRGDKATVLRYVRSLRKRGVPSIITLYAIRDLVGTEREHILGLRS